MPSLSDLFPIFDRLDRGESVLLGRDSTDSKDSLPPVDAGAWLGVRSSGSTGNPKIVWRRWETLRAEVRTNAEVLGWHWASPFGHESFAGVQAALQAWATGGTITSLDNRWDAAWESARSRPWQAISCTPTYLDLLLQNEPAAARSPDPLQITLGGEVLRPACGSRFAQRFPNARFTIVYASAEWGVLLKTHRLDGWYEVESLERRFPRWRISDGVLELAETNGTWRSSGDRVEQDGPLIRVVGRADRVANVAGTKINLDEIGRLAESIPGIRRALAVAEPNDITGQIIVLRYAPEGGANADGDVEPRLSTALRAMLPKPAWPRKWIQDELLPGTNAKRRLYNQDSDDRHVP
jgi:acyl-coenzyme A synthetase/AMP-(fatty) acid ligase